jgi:hypothetical protein
MDASGEFETHTHPAGLHNAADMPNWRKPDELIFGAQENVRHHHDIDAAANRPAPDERAVLDGRF